jgi:hypothetical protein
MSFSDSWTAHWESLGLHIAGMTDRVPNTFSTARLVHVPAEESDTRTYRLMFGRDKEPYCDHNLVGPVHHLDSSAPRSVRRIRVLSGDGVEIAVFAVRPPPHAA